MIEMSGDRSPTLLAKKNKVISLLGTYDQPVQVKQHTLQLPIWFIRALIESCCLYEIAQVGLDYRQDKY